MTTSSWDDQPEAKIRMREGGLDLLLKSLGEEGVCMAGTPRIQRLEDGIYIEIPTNVGKTGNIVFLGLDIFIPVKKSIAEKMSDIVGESKVDVTEPIVGPVDV